MLPAWRALKNTNYSRGITNSRNYLCSFTRVSACCPPDLPFNYVADVGRWRQSERGKRLAVSLTRSEPIGTTGSLNAASPRVTAAICLRSYLLGGAEPNPSGGGGGGADTWQMTVCTVAVWSPRSVSSQEECPGGINFLWKGSRGECVGVFAAVNNGQTEEDRLQVQTWFFKHENALHCRD